MKILENDKLFGKISIVDIVVVLILVVVVANVITTYTKVNKENGNVGNTSSITFEYDIKFEYVRPTTGEILQVGDAVFDKVSGTEIGEITSVVATNSMQQFNSLDGTITQKEIDGKADILITVKTKGSIKNSEYMANDLIRILIGKNIEIKTKYVDVAGTILDIRKLDK